MYTSQDEEKTWLSNSWWGKKCYEWYLCQFQVREQCVRDQFGVKVFSEFFVEITESHFFTSCCFFCVSNTFHQHGPNRHEVHDQKYSVCKPCSGCQGLRFFERICFFTLFLCSTVPLGGVIGWAVKTVTSEGMTLNPAEKKDPSKGIQQLFWDKGKALDE